VSNNPYGEAPPPPDPPSGEPPREVKGWAVAIGIVLGLFGTVVWMTIVFTVAYSFSMEQATNSTDALVFVFFILPFPVALLLLCFRRTRQAAAGFVLGMAIGTLLIAGLCTSIIVPGLVA
jgi:hypothetical protein